MSRPLPLDATHLDKLAEAVRTHGPNACPIGDATAYALIDQARAAIEADARLSRLRPLVRVAVCFEEGVPCGVIPTSPIDNLTAADRAWAMQEDV